MNINELVVAILKILTVGLLCMLSIIRVLIATGWVGRGGRGENYLHLLKLKCCHYLLRLTHWLSLFFNTELNFFAVLLVQFYFLQKKGKK